MRACARPLRVGYVLKKFPRLSETFILNEILGLEEQGIEVSVHSLLLPDDGRFHAELGRLSAQVTYLPPLGQASVCEAVRTVADGVPNAGTIFRFLEKVPQTSRGAVLLQALHLAGSVRARGIDHLHAHFMSGAARTAYVAHLVTGVPFSVTVHAKDIFRNAVNASIFREIADAADSVVTVSDDNKRFVAERFLDGDAGGKIRRIYNGIPLQEIAPRRGMGEGTVLAVGRLVEKKGFHLLLEACAALSRQGRPVPVEVVGDGEEGPSLERLRDRLGLEGLVTFTGAQSRAVVLDRMRCARLLAVPCVTAADGNRDALPTVVLEALAVGLPPVATRLGGIPEMVDHERNGLLVEPGDTAALAAAIARLSSDDALWRRLSEAGRPSIADRFDRSRTLPQLLEVFRAAGRAA